MLISALYPGALLGVVGVGVLLMIIRWYATGRIARRTPVDWGVFLLILMLPITLWATLVPTITFPQVYRLLVGVLFMYAIVNWCDTIPRFRLLVLAIILVSFLLALFATISVEWSLGKLLIIPQTLYDQFVLIVQDTVHKNVMAGNLVILLPVSLGLLFFAGREIQWRYRLILVVVVGVVMAILFLTQSRGAILALGCALVMLIVLRLKWGWLLLPVLLIGVGGILIQSGERRFLEALSAGVSLEGVEGRLEVWSRAFYMIQDFPLTGIGFGSFGLLSDNVYPLFLALPGSVPHAHNLYLQVAVDLGIPGLIAWLSILILVIASAWKIYRTGRKSSNRWFAGLGAGFLGSQVALMIHGILDVTIWGMVRPAPVLWALWGIILAGSIYIESWCGEPGALPGGIQDLPG